MAGEWLKFDSSTPEKPEVFAITLALGWDDPDLVVGKLLKMWRWFDQHTVNGNASTVTLALLDRVIGVTGFAKATLQAGWLLEFEGGLCLPHFDRHNGKTAKDRAQTAKRAATFRANSDADNQSNGDGVTNALPREEEEKRREDIKPSSKKIETPRGSRLDSTWIAPDEFIEFCKAERPDLDPNALQNKFRDYWSALPGKDGSKTDWLATWRNFVRSERASQAPRSANGYESAKDKSRREAMEQLTGSARNEQHSELRDIN